MPRSNILTAHLTPRRHRRPQHLFAASRPTFAATHTKMLHKIKRNVVGGLQARNEPKNAQFENAQQRLDNIERALTNALDSIDKAERSWVAVADAAQDFCDGLHSLYPQDDDIRALFKKTLDETNSLDREVKTDPDVSSNIKTIERVVRGYLTEIKTLKGEYPKVEIARRDFAMYQRKVDKLEHKDAADDKKARFLELLEGARATYHSTLDGIIHRMNSTYDKSPTMFRAAYVAYWLTQRKEHAAVSLYFKPAIEYAADNETNLFTGLNAGKSA